MMANGEVELEQLVMKDTHKATKFFIDFYWITLLLQYNIDALYWRTYLTLPKRTNNEMVHFDKPHLLGRLQDLIQKIDQHYWEWKAELLQEVLLAPKQEIKNDCSTWTLNPDHHQNQAGPSNPNLHPNLNSS